MRDASPYLDEKVYAQLRQDFLCDARERLDTMESAAGGAEAGGAQSLLAVRRDAHNLKGLGGSFGFPSITVIAHRLEDYAAELPALAGRHVNDVLAFIDCMRGIIDRGEDPGDGRTSELLRGLPAHAGIEIEIGEVRDVEVLLVTPSRAIGRMLTGELRSLGFRVSTVRSPWQALEMAARTAPDLVITSAVMDHVNGIDLARALKAMSVTEGLNLALLTSLASDHPDMRRLPADVPVVHLGQSLADELADMVTGFGLA